MFLFIAQCPLVTDMGTHPHKAAYPFCANVTQVRAELVILKPSLTF